MCVWEPERDFVSLSSCTWVSLTRAVCGECKYDTCASVFVDSTEDPRELVHPRCDVLCGQEVSKKVGRL